jgi:hypothetical protein
MQRSFTILPNIDHMDKFYDDVVAIWLDDTIGTSIESQWFNIARQLRQIISHVQVFTNVHKCIDYVCSVGIEHIFLIVAGTYVDDFDIRLFEEIMHDVFIYVLTSNKLEYNASHINIRGCFDNTSSLINQIRDDYMVYTTDNMSDMNFIRRETNENTTRCINPQLIQQKCFSLMMDILRRMPCPREQSIDRLIEFSRSQHSANPVELEILEEFQRTYQSNHAIKWYAEESFLYRSLNQSLRTNNIDAIMAFSFFLVDIYDQLNELYCQQRVNQPITIYHVQAIGIDDLKKLKLNIGGFISNNSLLATTIDRCVAEMFAGVGVTSTGISVIYEISFDSTSSTSKPLANTSSFSHITDESEVLFANGHIFRIDSCELATNGIWLAKLTSCDDSHSIVQNSSDYFDIAILQLLEILPKISPKTNEANDRMLQWWRLYCADDPLEQAKIDQFEESYRTDSAIRWYTKDSLLYRLLNAALRQENIDMIIDFRYFIIDLYEQLTKSHLDYIRSFKEQNLTVYRGQKISSLELRRLKHNVGNYISINSLFSASLSSEVALCFAKLNESDRKQCLQSVLFQIDINMEKLARSCRNHIFANIINMSCFVDEDEVLFMANTHFRIQSVINWNGAFWLVLLTLPNQDDENSNDMIIMNRYLKHLTNLVVQHYGDNIRSFFKK